MTDLNSLAVFYRVAEAQSFSEAARRLKMPVSTVSRKVADLEDELGVRLLDRSTRSLRLTQVGAEVLEQAARVADVAETVQSIASDQHATISGTLRLSAPPSISDTLLAPLLSAFQAAWPEVRVRVYIADRYVDPIEEGIDLVLRLGSARDSALISRKLLRYRHRLLASPQYIAEHGAPSSPADLAAHRLVAFYHWRPDTAWTLGRSGEDPHVIPVAPHFAMNDYLGLAEALVAGAGVGDLPPVVRPDLVRDGRLVEVMPDWRFPTRELALVHLSGRHVPRPVRAFIDLALKVAPRLFPDLPD